MDAKEKMVQAQAVQQAAALRRAGRWAEAEAAYARLLTRWPDLPDCWYNLGFVRTRLGQAQGALKAYDEALRRGVSGPEEVHLNRARLFADYLRRNDEAERALNAALACNRNYVPALLNLGNLQEDLGDRVGASASYQRALDVDATCFEALARLINVKKSEQIDARDVGALRAALVHPRAHIEDRASIGFALGRALDARGDYDGAFAAYAEANKASKLSAGQGQGVYDRAAHEALIDAIIAAFTAPVENETSTPAPATFICGMFRSGSTLLEQALGAHPRVTAGDELDLIPAIVRGEMAPFPGAMAKASPAGLEALSGRYRAQVAEMFPGADLLTDKRPDNFLYIGLIKTLFPSAKIINTLRDPRDNCLSVFFLHLNHVMTYAFSLEDIAHYFMCYRRLMTHWKKLYPDDIFDFDYDAFVAAPRETLAPVLQFLGLDWREECLAFYTQKNSVKTASVWQVRQPLYAQSSGRWRHYEKHLGQVRAMLGQ